MLYFRFLCISSIFWQHMIEIVRAFSKKNLDLIFDNIFILCGWARLFQTNCCVHFLSLEAFLTTGWCCGGKYLLWFMDRQDLILSYCPDSGCIRRIRIRRTVFQEMLWNKNNSMAYVKIPSPYGYVFWLSQYLKTNDIYQNMKCQNNPTNQTQ